MPAYHRPNDLPSALDILAGGPVRVAAGCTDLYPATAAKALPGDILDITAIAALRGIRQVDGGWRIGAATTWTDLLRAPLPPAFDALKLAAREVGSVQIQNAGTLAGNLCTASPAGDGIPALMVIDAEVELQSATGRRVLPLAEFVTGARKTALRPDEMVTAILVPKVEGRGDFLKLGARKYLVISIAMVAARFEISGDRFRDVALAVGSCAPVAVRLTALEQALKGQPVQGADGLAPVVRLIPALAPIDDIRGSAGYRREAVEELVRRLLQRCAERQRGAAA